MNYLDEGRYNVLSEFSDDEKKYWFNMKAHCVVPHIDTFYYTVSIADDSNFAELPGLRNLLKELQDLKAQKLIDRQANVDFLGLSVEATGFSIYEYRLCLNECFDIFISKYLPNLDTPRMVVQLRSRYLVLEGVDQAILKSFDYASLILSSFGLSASAVRINRVDYAFHCNTIQKPYRFFRDEKLCASLKTDLRIYQKIGTIGEKIDIDYFSLGNKKSNNIFLRIYNKSREVVEQNYKAFFLERWLEHGLISRYDYECMQTAFSLKSYKVGLLVGRARWYINHGKNDELKSQLEKVLVNCYQDSDNASFIEEQLDGVLPPVTVIVNVEFQTKRKFYATFDPVFLSGIKFDYDGNPLLREVMKILYIQPEVLDYLTSKSVCFLVNRKERDSPMCDWWRRIHSCRIPYSTKKALGVFRSHEREPEIRRAKSRMQNAIAQYNIINRQSLESRSFQEDVSDVLCSLNDNDLHGLQIVSAGKEIMLESFGYNMVQKRKARQYKGIIKPADEPEDELPY